MADNLLLFPPNSLKQTNLLMGVSGPAGSSNLLLSINNLDPAQLTTSGFLLEDSSGVVLLEDSSILLIEMQ